MTDDTTKRKRGRPKSSRPFVRPKSIEGSTFVSIRLDTATLARLDKIAADRNETRSAAIRSLIDLY